MSKIKIDKQRLKISWLDPATMKPNPANHRKHPERQREILRNALSDEGWLDPIIWNKRTGHILDGHARGEEAIADGVKEVPVIVLDVDEDMERRITVRHDRIGAMAELDLDILRENVEGLDLGEFGWDDPVWDLEAGEFQGTVETDDELGGASEMITCPYCKKEFKRDRM